jgi:hypothetical protein
MLSRNIQPCERQQQLLNVSVGHVQQPPRRSHMRFVRRRVLQRRHSDRLELQRMLPRNLQLNEGQQQLLEVSCRHFQSHLPRKQLHLLSCRHVQQQNRSKKPNRVRILPCRHLQSRRCNQLYVLSLRNKQLNERQQHMRKLSRRHVQQYHRIQ